jgi:hypothetical protein
VLAVIVLLLLIGEGSVIDVLKRVLGGCGAPATPLPRPEPGRHAAVSKPPAWRRNKQNIANASFELFFHTIT